MYPGADLRGQAVEGTGKDRAALERGDVPLDRSIEIYERGEALKKHCETLLRQPRTASRKIRLDRAGQPVGTEPLDEA
jgi:exodeoxyribonuclease VII small subunit